MALSRSVFSARFTELVGEPPITYLTRWRMQRAKRWLKEEVSWQQELFRADETIHLD